MATSYTKLARGNLRIIGTSRLYLGDDHLLLVDNIGYSERYKRFYFKDIQAITLRRTQLARILNWSFAVLLIAGAIGAYFSFTNNVDAGGWFLICAVCLPSLIPFFISAFCGDSCECVVQTEVQRERIGAIPRIRRARKVIARLQTAIANAQANEPIPDEEPEEEVLSTAPAQPNPRVADTGTKTDYTGWCHAVLYGLCLGVAVTVVVCTFIGGPAPFVLHAVLALALFACNIVAAIKQLRSHLSSGQQVMTWGLIVYHFMLAFALYIAVIVESIAGDSMDAMNPGQMLWDSMLEAPILDSILWSCIFGFVLVVTLGIGLFGGVGIRREMRDIRLTLNRAVAAPPPLSTPSDPESEG